MHFICSNYLAATRIGGYSWETVGRIWHQALKTAGSYDNFETLAGKTVEAAKKLGYSTTVIAHVESAWRDVGVKLRVDRDLLGVSSEGSTDRPRPVDTSSKLLQIICVVGLMALSFWAGGKRVSV